jgi:diguanylate cyclase (GGDEF)-like protein
MEKVFLYEEVTMISKIDSLTGLYVHREFQERLENELKRCARYQKELALIMGDIDFFKKMNDYYGHLAGDDVLKTIALILKNNTDAVDSVARYGGEEFVIILPDSDKKKAFQKAETIRKSIENYEFAYKGTKMGVTMSFGVAAYPGDATTRRAIIDKADKALYKAKETGRNKVIRSE